MIRPLTIAALLAACGGAVAAQEPGVRAASEGEAATGGEGVRRLIYEATPFVCVWGGEVEFVAVQRVGDDLDDPAAYVALGDWSGATVTQGRDPWRLVLTRGTDFLQIGFEEALRVVGGELSQGDCDTATEEFRQAIFDVVPDDPSQAALWAQAREQAGRLHERIAEMEALVEQAGMTGRISCEAGLLATVAAMRDQVNKVSIATDPQDLSTVRSSLDEGLDALGAACAPPAD